MESWRKVWRDAAAPLLSDAAVNSLAQALRDDSPRLIQGATCTPPLQCMRNWPVEKACALAYCGWKGECLVTVAEVEEYFAQTCFDIDLRLNEPAGCGWFIDWYDETPRAEMRRLLLPEVELEIERRNKESRPGA